MGVFKNYAKYYDLLYLDKNYKKEADYVRGLILKYSKNTKNILELGCGTGIHAIELAKKGYQIDGVDFSKEMLKMAEKRLSKLPANLADKLSFQSGDVRKFRNKKKYDVVISLFHILSYMPSNEAIEAMLETASVHLKSGGLFIFDCWYGPAVLTDRPTLRVKELENEEIKVVRIARPEMLPNENQVDVNYHTLIIDKKTGKTDENRETHRMRYLFQPEIEMFLEKAGFELIKAEQWLNGKKPSFNSWGVCFIVKKI